MTDPQAKRILFSYARRQWRVLSFALLAFILAAMVEPVLPALFKSLLDSGFEAGLTYPLWMVPVAVIGLFVLRSVVNYAGAYAMHAASTAMVLNLRCDLMRVILCADSHLFNELSPGRVTAKLIDDPQLVAQNLSSAIVSMIRDTATLLFLILYLIYLNPALTGLAFVAMPLLALAVDRVQKRLRRVNQAQYAARMDLVTAVEDNTRAWRVVRTFGATELEFQRFERQARHFRHMTLKQAAAASLITPLTQVVAAIGVSVVLTMAVWQVSQGQATVGEFVSFITALLMVISPMRHLSDLVPAINGALTNAKGAFELLQVPAERDDGTLTLAHCAGHVAFENVVLQYPGATQAALSGLNLCIAAGQTVALVGPSGAGKSSVIAALLRFANLQSGQITLDGTPINDLTLASLRQHFAVVSQDIVLFDGSIAENVAYASQTGIDRQRVEDCLRNANLWEHVQKLPAGIDTSVGTNGNKLSGGQRQRLAIARALYRDASIWIFDEATSALDTDSEEVVQRSIEHLRHSKTLIMIAHRLSTVRHADSIAVLAEGRVVEQGNHAQLMAQHGVYASMVRLQTAD